MGVLYLTHPDVEQLQRSANHQNSPGMFNDSKISFPSLSYSDCWHHNHFSIFPAHIDFPPLKPFSEPDYFKALAAVCSNADLLFAFRTSLASSPMYLVTSPCQHEHHRSCRRTADSKSSKAKWVSENEHKRTFNST